MIGPLSNNPFKFVPAYPDVARVLLLQRSKAVMDGPAAIRDTLENAEDSYLAQITAMRASVLKAFDILEASTADSQPGSRDFMALGRGPQVAAGAAAACRGAGRNASSLQ